jgi:hypothetical protein
VLRPRLFFRKQGGAGGFSFHLEKHTIPPMKMTTCTLCGLTILLLGLTTLVSAQGFQLPVSANVSLPPIREETFPGAEKYHEMVDRSPAMKLAAEQSLRHNLLSFWTGNGTSLFIDSFLHIEDSREAFGISQEQYQKIVSWMGPDSTELHREMMQLDIETPGGILAEDASEEVQQKWADLSQRSSDIFKEGWFKNIYETLTPDQLQTIREYQIATMSEYPFVSTNMFEALDLSGKQKQQLEEIKKKLYPEFEKNANKYFEREKTHWQKIVAFRHAKTPEEKERIYKELQQDRQELSKGLVSELKIKMFDVLTDEQWDRFLKLVDDPPDYIKRRIAKMRGDKGEDKGDNKAGATGAEVWTPGPDSWRPGDPVPEEYRQERNQRRRFPRGE